MKSSSLLIVFTLSLAACDSLPTAPSGAGVTQTLQTDARITSYSRVTVEPNVSCFEGVPGESFTIKFTTRDSGDGEKSKIRAEIHQGPGTGCQPIFVKNFQVVRVATFNGKHQTGTHTLTVTIPDCGYKIQPDVWHVNEDTDDWSDLTFPVIWGSCAPPPAPEPPPYVPPTPVPPPVIVSPLPPVVPPLPPVIEPPPVDVPPTPPVDQPPPPVDQPPGDNPPPVTVCPPWEEAKDCLDPYVPPLPPLPPTCDGWFCKDSGDV